MLTNAQIVSKSDLQVIDGEPRIEDIRLAQLMGFKNPKNIRKLIARYLPTLERFGIALQRGALSPVGMWGGQQPVTITYLNRRQALFLATKSGTPQAAEVTVQMVEVFDQYLTDQRQPPALPAPAPLPSKLLKRLAAEALKTKPEWRQVRGYAKRGFRSAEIAKLCGLSTRRVSAIQRDLRAAGLLGEVQHG